MPSSIFLATDFKLSVERARRRGNNIAAQNAEPLPRFNQFLVGKCSDKFAVFVFAEFTEPYWATVLSNNGGNEEPDPVVSDAKNGLKPQSRAGVA